MASTSPQWDPEDDLRDPVPELDVVPAPGGSGNDATGTRRRIERLREERLLQQALSDVFDL